MSVYISWALVGYAVFASIMSIRRAVLSKQSIRGMVGDSLGTAFLVIIIGIIPLGWNGTIPIAVWWLLGGLLGILAGTVTFRVLAGQRNADDRVGVSV